MTLRINKTDKAVRLVVTCDPLLENISMVFHKHLDLLCTDQEVERVFTPGLMALFRIASIYLV